MNRRRQFPTFLALAAIFTCSIAFAAEPAPEKASLDNSLLATASQSIVRLSALQWLSHSEPVPAPTFGITLDPGADHAAAEKPLVILIHGYHSAPQRLAPLALSIRTAGYPCGALRYPNDQPIADSAQLLSQELRRLAKEQPGRKIILVTHSMGGLVARQTIETPDLNPGNVSQLIMIAPPNHGTTCAYISFTSDLWEHGDNISRRTPLDCLFATGDKPQHEARNDLKPNSAFLRQLNAQALNPNVHYCLLLGTGALLTETELNTASQFLSIFAHVAPCLSAVEPLAQRILSDFNDAASLSDGVVSVVSGRLNGVADTVLLGFDHWNVIGPPLIPPVADLHREVLKRISGELLAHNSAAAN